MGVGSCVGEGFSAHSHVPKIEQIQHLHCWIAPSFLPCARRLHVHQGLAHFASCLAGALLETSIKQFQRIPQRATLQRMSSIVAKTMPRLIPVTCSYPVATFEGLDVRRLLPMRS